MACPVKSKPFQALLSGKLRFKGFISAAAESQFAWPVLRVVAQHADASMAEVHDVPDGF